MTLTFPALRECEREANIAAPGWPALGTDGSKWYVSTNPVNPVFSVPPSQHEDYPTANGHWAGPADGNWAGQASAENSAVESASTEIDAIAAAVEELQSRLEQAHSQLGQVTAIRTTEYEIGRLFLEAQRFSEASLARLEEKVQEILAEAEAKAAAILREATEEAHEIRRQAQQNSSFIPAQTAQELQSAIAGFAGVNSELVRELNALNSVLAPPANDQRPPSSGRSFTTMGPP